MKTEDLIELLARDAGPAPRALALRRLGPVAALGVAASAALALLTMGPIPAQMLATPAPWMKLAYTGLLALAAGWLAARLGRPASRAAAPGRSVAAVVAGMVLIGFLAWIGTDAAARDHELLGLSWRICSRNVLLLSLPALAGSMWALRGLAPTRPRAAGFAAGLFAGAVGAMGYALACPEVSATFVAVWYTLGIAATAAFGAWLGPRLLRW